MNRTQNKIVPAPPKVAVVTVNWNGWRNTRECLQALRLSKDVDWRAIVVDNDSTDDSVEKLSSFLVEGEELVRSPRNGGWTGGNNLGVRRALEGDDTHILLLNNDAFVQPDAIKTLVRAAVEAGNPRLVVGAQMLTPNGAPVEYAAAGFDPATGLPVWRPLATFSGDAGSGLISVGVPHGGAMLFHRRAFEDVGFFDDAFHLYLDESDWCRRAAQVGYSFAIVEQAKVRHIEAASTGGRESPLYRYFMLRNKLLFAKKHLTVRQRLRVAREVYWEVRAAARSLGGGFWPLALLFSREPRLRARRRGVIDYLTDRFGDCPPPIRGSTALWLIENPV